MADEPFRLGDEQARRSGDDVESDEHQVAIICTGCGAGGIGPATASTYSCDGCGGEYLLFRCPHCHADTHASVLAVGKPGTCSSCGRTAKWREWERSPTTFEAVASNLSISQEEASDPYRREIWGVGIAATGLPGLGPGIGCSITFTREAAVIRAFERNGRSAEVASLPFAAIRLLRIAGRGAVRSTSGGGWMGGGFGAQGFVEGVLLSGALNALTARATTRIETLVHIGAGPTEVLIQNSTITPEILEVRLAPVFARIEAAQAGVVPTARRARPVPGLAQELEGLASLRERGVLTADEFERAKVAALRDHDAAI